MPELTPQDRESYQKLRAAAEKLNQSINPGGKLGNPASVLQSLTHNFFSNLPDAKKLSNLETLQEKVELAGGYLAVHKILTGQIPQDKQGDFSDALQDLLNQYNELHGFIEAADDDFVDEIIPLCSDPLFLGFLQDDPSIKTWTQQLMNDQVPVLTEIQVQNLIEAWGLAVSKVVDDTQKKDEIGGKVNPGQSTTIAHFFCIHDQLEGLYSQLSTAVSLSS